MRTTPCTFDALVDFIDKRMRMSQIYQPLLIRALVDAGGAATLRQLAQAFLAQDESQLLFYERRIRQMPLRVLRKHGVVQAEGQLVSLACGRTHSISFATHEHGRSTAPAPTNDNATHQRRSTYVC